MPIDSGRFNLVRQVSLHCDGAGAGFGYVVVGKQVSPGPRIRIFNAAGERTGAVVDAVVRGC